MVSSVEMVLWAIHHATTLLFGVFASAALCGVEINRRHALELVLVGVVTGAAFSIANAVGGGLFAPPGTPSAMQNGFAGRRPGSRGLPEFCLPCSALRVPI